jgi:hypothetical protein
MARNHALISVVLAASFVTLASDSKPLQDCAPTSAGNVDAVEVEPCSKCIKQDELTVMGWQSISARR